MKNYSEYDIFSRFSPLTFAVITLPCVESQGIGECVSDIYQWSLAVVGIVAFVQIIYAGFLYLTAAGNTSKTGQARSKIGNAVLGIVLLFSSYLILRTINPDLVGGTFSLPKITKTDTFKTGGDGTVFCDKDKTCIENFDVMPKVASIKADTELEFKIKLYASTTAIKNACGVGTEKVAYKVLMRDNATLALKKIRGGTTSEEIRKSDFGDGKALTRDFKEKISAMGITEASKTKGVQYFVNFYCFGNKEKELNTTKLSSVAVTIIP